MPLEPTETSVFIIHLHPLFLGLRLIGAFIGSVFAVFAERFIEGHM